MKHQTVFTAPVLALMGLGFALGACEYVPVTQAAGRVAAASAGLYPPGIPLVCAGEEITAEIADLLASVGKRERFGMEGDMLLCMR